MPAKKGRRMPTGGLVGRPTKEVKRTKTAAATTARSLYRLQEQLEILKSQLHQDMVAVKLERKLSVLLKWRLPRSRQLNALQKIGRRRRSWDSEWKGQEGGWKPANFANLVRHSIGEMNAWIEKYGGGKLSGTIGNLVVVDFDKEEGPEEGDEREDGLEPHLCAARCIVINGNQQTRCATIRRKKPTRYRRLGSTKQQMRIELTLDVNRMVG